MPYSKRPIGQDSLHMPASLLRPIKALLLTLLCYSLLGFLILPGIAQRIANQQLAAHAQVTAQLERIELNPFTLELRVHGLRLGEAEQPQVAFRQLAVNLQLDSLWGEALHLRELYLDGLHLEVLFAKDGTLNLTQLFRSSGQPADVSEEEKPLFALQVDRLTLHQGYLHFQDLRPRDAIDFISDDLSFELDNLSTLPERNADMRLHARTPDGGTLRWSGDLSVQPLRSSGQLELKAAQLKPWWPYVREHLALTLTGGKLDLSGQYRLDLAKQTQLIVEQGALQLSEVAVEAEDGPHATLGSLQLDELALDLAARDLRIGRLHSQAFKTSATRLADGSLDWQKILPRTEEAAPAAATQEGSELTPPQEPPTPWRIRLASGELQDYQLDLQDRVPGEDVNLHVGPLSLAIENFDSKAEAPFNLQLNSGIGSRGSITAEGPVGLAPLSASLALGTKDLDLRPVQAYLSPYVRLELRSGFLSSQLKLEMTQQQALQLAVDGDLQVTQLHTQDGLRQRDFLKWPRLGLEGIAYRHGASLAIEQVMIEQPYVRFVINEDRTTNISELIVPQPDSTPASQNPASQPLAIRIGAIRIKDGSGHFADFSLMPPFATALQELNGQIGTLDNSSPRAARVDVKGKVDRYAPVSITGELTPFEPLRSLDIATSFKNVELTTLTPYSGKFAGYRIRKGRLNLELHYRISEGKLQASNKVVLEQLQLGERVDSPDAVDLPVRLAVALLKDSKGVIDIELPVTGDLNDPQFSVMPIVWQTLRNLVVRAAQAPFKFIGGLAGAGERDLSQVNFSAGNSALDEQARSGLDLLAKALLERPALRLEIEGGASFASDGPGLAELRLEREYQSTWYRILQRRGDKVPASEDLLEVPDGDKAALLEGIYRARLNRQPPSEWAELDDDQRHARMREEVLAQWATNQSLARRLAQQRAAQIKEYLVEQGQLPPERVYLMDVQIVEPGADGQTPTTLHLGSE